MSARKTTLPPGMSEPDDGPVFPGGDFFRGRVGRLFILDDPSTYCGWKRILIIETAHKHGVPVEDMLWALGDASATWELEHAAKQRNEQTKYRIRSDLEGITVHLTIAEDPVTRENILVFHADPGRFYK